MITTCKVHKHFLPRTSKLKSAICCYNIIISTLVHFFGYTTIITLILNVTHEKTNIVLRSDFELRSPLPTITLTFELLPSPANLKSLVM